MFCPQWTRPPPCRAPGRSRAAYRTYRLRTSPATSGRAHRAPPPQRMIGPIAGNRSLEWRLVQRRYGAMTEIPAELFEAGARDALRDLGRAPDRLALEVLSGCDVLIPAVSGIRYTRDRSEFVRFVLPVIES